MLTGPSRILCGNRWDYLPIFSQIIQLRGYTELNGLETWDRWARGFKVLACSYMDRTVRYLLDVLLIGWKIHRSFFFCLFSRLFSGLARAGGIWISLLSQPLWEPVIYATCSHVTLPKLPEALAIPVLSWGTAGCVPVYVMMHAKRQTVTQRVGMGACFVQVALLIPSSELNPTSFPVTAPHSLSLQWCLKQINCNETSCLSCYSIYRINSFHFIAINTPAL